MSNPFSTQVSSNTDWLFLRNIICLAAGILLWLYPNSFAKGMVIGLGALLVLYGVIAFLLSYVRVRRSALIHTATINAIVSLIAGLSLIIAPSFFVKFIIPAIGIVVIGLAILQLFEIIAFRKYSDASALWFLSPLVILGLGIVAVINPTAISTTIGYIAAAALIYSGLSGMYVAFNIKKGVKKVKEQLKIQQAQAQAEIKKQAQEKADAEKQAAEQAAAEAKAEEEKRAAAETELKPAEEEPQTPTDPLDYLI